MKAVGKGLSLSFGTRAGFQKSMLSSFVSPNKSCRNYNRIILFSIFIFSDISRSRRSLIGPIYRLYDNDKHGPEQSSWPPKSRENWMEVMVVADGKMLSYHGDHLEVK